MTSWMDAGRVPGDPDWSGGKVFIDRREVTVDAPGASTKPSASSAEDTVLRRRLALAGAGIHGQGDLAAPAPSWPPGSQGTRIR